MKAVAMNSKHGPLHVLSTSNSTLQAHVRAQIVAALLAAFDDHLLKSLANNFILFLEIKVKRTGKNIVAMTSNLPLYLAVVPLTPLASHT